MVLNLLLACASPDTSGEKVDASCCVVDSSDGGGGSGGGSDSTGQGGGGTVDTGRADTGPSDTAPVDTGPPWTFSGWCGPYSGFATVGQVAEYYTLWADGGADGYLEATVTAMVDDGDGTDVTVAVAYDCSDPAYGSWGFDGEDDYRCDADGVAFLGESGTFRDVNGNSYPLTDSFSPPRLLLGPSAVAGERWSQTYTETLTWGDSIETYSITEDVTMGDGGSVWVGAGNLDGTLLRHEISTMSAAPIDAWYHPLYGDILDPGRELLNFTLGP